MSEIAREFIAKAKADWHTAHREAMASDNYNADAVRFHAQQTIEKFFRALLIWHGARAPKTHDLFELDRLLKLADASWSCDPADLQILTPAAIDYRYPGTSASRQDALDAFAAATRLQNAMAPRLLVIGSPP